MKPQKQPSKPSHQDLFRIELDRLINETHPLVKLSAQMDWLSLDEHFGACFCEEGRPAINTRLMVSLHYRKYANNLSDEETLALWVENPYLQIACVDLSRSAHPCLWLITWDPTETTATRPLAIQKDGTWYCYGHDLTKNVCEVFGSSGNIRTVYSYTPYGEVTAEGNVSQPVQWSSEFKDEELELVYYNFRHYNPNDGRGINRDPIAEQGGWNLYCSFGNNIILKYDVLGRKWKIESKEDLNQEEPIRFGLGSGRGLTSVSFIKKLTTSIEKKEDCYKLSLEGTLIVEILVLKQGHPFFQVGHLSWYDKKWGNPRGERNERMATIAHECDHRDTYTIGFRAEMEKLNTTYDGSTYLTEAEAKEAEKEVLKKIKDIYDQAKKHSNDFDDKMELRQGGMYSEHPFKYKETK